MTHPEKHIHNTPNNTHNMFNETLSKTHPVTLTYPVTLSHQVAVTHPMTLTQLVTLKHLMTLTHPKALTPSDIQPVTLT